MIINKPIFLTPVYKDYIWGGTKLKDIFNKNTPYSKTAESWEIASNQHGISHVSNGVFEGKGIDELFNNKGIKHDIFGSYCDKLDSFPLLIKYIDAADNLSVQVHPDDDYAIKHENSNGKAEAWYIIDCEDNSNIICGLNDNISKNQLSVDNIKEHLNYVPIKKGDIIYIPPKTLHAILKNTLICEIQQNSDLTYRVYDWDRVDVNGNSRELHINKALDVIDCENHFTINHTNTNTNINIDNTDKNSLIQNILTNQYFTIDKLTINQSDAFNGQSNPNTFIAVNIISGNGDINGIEIHQGDSFIIPACMGNYSIQGELTALMSYINN